MAILSVKAAGWLHTAVEAANVGLCGPWRKASNGGAVQKFMAWVADGAANTFTVDNLTKITKLHRTDWQGVQALSASARTNLCPYAANFGQWTQANGCLVTTDVASPLAPDGTATMDLLTAGAASASSRNSPSMAVPAGTDIFASIYISKGTGTLPTISIYDSTTVTRLARIAISWTGTVPVLGGLIGMVGTPTVTASSIAGVYRIDFKFNTGAKTSIKMLAYPNQDGSGNGTTYFWGAMVSVGGGAYIPTTTAPVTLTDYALASEVVTLGETPVAGAVFTLDGDITADVEGA